jgi:hypothetical protein
MAETYQYFGQGDNRFFDHRQPSGVSRIQPMREFFMDAPRQHTIWPIKVWTPLFGHTCDQRLISIKGMQV